MAEILVTKIMSPRPRPGLVRRERLLDALHRQLDAKLFLVCAPAGYGKTSLLVDFAQDAGMPVAWYRLDESDADPATFVAYLVAALRRCFPNFGTRTLALLQGSPADSWGAWATALVNDMVADIPEYFAVILDDYHRLPDNSPVHRLFDWLLEHLPGHAHFIVAGRLLPPVNLIALAAYQEVAGLGMAELRFTPAEIRTLLQQQNQVEVSEAEAAELAERTEGWVAGLILTTLTPLSRLDTVADSAAGRERLYEFLASEVIAQQPPELRRFLLDTSIVETMCPDLCQALTDMTDTASWLRRLEERNLFTSRIDSPAEDEPWYRYHQLFRDYLQDRLRREEPARLSALHRRAGVWYAARGASEVAVTHFLAAGEFTAAVSVMERTARELFLAGRTATILSWCQSLPPSALAQAPYLSLYAAKVLADTGDQAGAAAALARTEACLSDRGDISGRAQVAVQRAWLAHAAGQYEQGMTEARRALRLTRRKPKDVDITAEAYRILGLCQAARGNLQEGEQQLARSLSLYRQLGWPYDIANTLQDLAYVIRQTGQVQRAMGFQDEALTIRRQLGHPGPLATLLNNIAYDHYVLGEYKQALELYEEALDLAEEAGAGRIEGFLQVGLGDVYRDLGLYDLANELYERAIASTRHNSDPRLLIYAYDGKATLYRFRGAHANALYWAGQAAQLAAGSPPAVAALARATWGITLVEIGEVAAGLTELYDVVLGLESQGALPDLARAQFLLARAEFMAGEEEAALRSLERALRLSRELGYDQFLVTEGRWALPLLEYAASQGIAPRQVSGLAERARQLPDQAQRLIAAHLEPREAGLPSLEVFTLGPTRVVLDGQDVPPEVWGAAKARLLFLYLVHAGPRTREEIGLELWPDFSPSRLKSNFDATLYRARRVVGSERIILANGRYDIARSGYWCDADAFQNWVRQARRLGPDNPRTPECWLEAVELYKGDYLPDVGATWCVSRRESLRLDYLEGLVALGDWAARRGDWRQAQNWYRRALEADEYQEDIYRKLIRAHLACDERGLAQAQLERCLRVLREELEVEPAPETLALSELIRLG